MKFTWSLVTFLRSPPVPPPPFKIWWGMFVGYFLLERVMFEFADKLSLFGRNRKRNKKDESSTLFDLYYSPSPVWEVSFFFNVGYKLTSSAFKDKKSSVLTYHQIIEAFKFSYAWRGLLGHSNPNINVGGNHSVVQIMPVFTFSVKMWNQRALRDRLCLHNFDMIWKTRIIFALL